MPDYSKCMIYKLCCKDTSIEDIYIGSTCNFNRRKSQHKYHCNNEKCNQYNYQVYKFIREHGDFENWDMVMIEERSVENKLQKEKLEREHIERLKPSLNCVIPTRTYKEWYEANKEQIAEQRKEYREQNKEQLAEKKKDYYQQKKEEFAKKGKEWYEAHKEEIAEQHKEYYKQNKEQILEKRKEYREKNKEQISKKSKEYREKNKEQISKKSKEKFTCECGSTLRKSDKSIHLRTQKHQDFINQQK